MQVDFKYSYIYFLLLLCYLFRNIGKFMFSLETQASSLATRCSTKQASLAQPRGLSKHTHGWSSSCYHSQELFILLVDITHIQDA